MRKAVADPPARRKILEAARRRFLEKGYEGASVDEICEDAGLTKGSFFHYFKSKDAVCEAALGEYQNEMRSRFVSCCCPKTSDPLARLDRFLEGLKKSFAGSKGAGCFMGAMAQELAESHPSIRRMCQNSFEAIAAFMEKDLAEAKKKHAPKSSVDPKGLARHFVVVMQGAMLLSRVRKDVAAKTEAIDHYRQYLKQVFQR